MVIAHYMTWYQTPDFSGSWGFWQVNRPGIDRAYWHEPDTTNSAGARDIASVYYPVIGPYDSANPDLCEYHILLAQMAGIDAFVCDWYGFDEYPEHPYDNTGFRALLRQAEKMNFKVAVCWEDRTMFQSGAQHASSRAEAVEHGKAIVRRLAKEYFPSPAYLRIDGRPVLMNFAWDEPRAGSTTLWPDEWDQVLEAAQPRPLLIHDFQAHHTNTYLERYDSVAPWGSCLHGRTDLPEFYARARNTLGQGRFGFLSATVRPGFDNRGSGGWGNDIALDDRKNGEVYRAIWESTLKHNVDFIQIATWNDMNEGGTIEPVRTGVTLPAFPAEGYGYRELETTRDFNARLGKPTVPAEALRLPERLYRLRQRARAEERQDLLAKLDAFSAGLLERPPAESISRLSELERELK